MLEKLNLRDELEQMRTGPNDPNCRFYGFSLTANEEGKVTNGIHSIFCGFADEDGRVELREARLVTKSLGETWRSIGEDFVYVYTARQMAVFGLMGGNALVLPEVAEAVVPNWLTPQASYQAGFSGYVSEEMVDASALKRTPSAKLRMRVLKRDGRKCRICGRNPDNHLDLELHVHHIRPWEKRGITDTKNLITLCQTCHKGLDPHYDPSLFSYLESSSKPKSERTKRYVQGIRNYRRVAQSDF